MKLKLVLLAGVATVTLSGAMLTPAIADDFYNSNGARVHDDQADATRALNLQALEAARDQTGASMSEPGDNDDNNAEDANDGQGGPEFEGPPGPDDMGVDPDDEDDQSDSPDDNDDDNGPDPR